MQSQKLYNFLYRNKKLKVFFTFFLLAISVSNATAKEKNYILVDDFEASSDTNYLNGKTGVFQDSSGGWCQASRYNQDLKNVYGGSASLFLAWDTSKKASFAGYWSDLKHLDLSDYNYLTFWIKGNAGGEILKVGLRGAYEAEYESKVFVHDAMKSGVTTKWQKVIIPLPMFNIIHDWSDVNMLSFCFEHSYNSGRGILYLDEIKFEK